MISLKVKNQAVDLPPSSAINLLIGGKFWELDFQKGSRSNPFTLPASPKNQQILGFPELIPNASKTLFNPLPAEVLLAGSQLYRGTFALRKASPRAYEGVFIFDAAELAPFAETPIRQMLRSEEHQFPNTSLNALESYTAADSDIVFPTIKVANILFNRYTTGYTIDQDDLQEGTFIPFLKMHYVFSLLIAQTGYTLANPDYYQAYPDVAKVTIFNNKELDVTLNTQTILTPIEGTDYGFVDIRLQYTDIELPLRFRIADHLPDVTFSTFLKAFRKLFGIYLDINSKYKTITVHFLKDLFRQTAQKDFTQKVNPQYTVEPPTYEGITFSFLKDTKDDYQKDQKTPDVTLSKLSAARNLGELPPLVPFGEQPNTYRFYVKENQYWATLKKSSGVVRRYYLADFLPRVEGEGKKNIDIPLAPVRSAIWLSYRGTEGQARQAGANTRIYHINKLQGQNGYIQITKAQNFEADTIHSPLADQPTYFDLAISHVRDEDSVEWTRFVPSNPILETHTPLTRKLLNQENANFPFRVFFYHGLQQRVENSNSYPYASPTNTSPRGTKIADFALRLAEADNIIDFFYTEYLNFVKYSPLYTFTAYLNINDLQNLKPTDIIRIRDSSFVIEEIDVSIDKTIQPATLKLRKLTSLAFTSSQPRTITTIYKENCNPQRTINTIYKENC